MKKKLLITGADGQLGQEIRQREKEFPEFEFMFTSRHNLPLNNLEAITHYFEEHRPNGCINCAAYTAVDKAENEKELAFLINGEAVGRLASECRKLNIPFLHISTDYVFDGTVHEPLSEEHPVNPVNAYGASKLLGEQLALKNNPGSVIVRTSWVYSRFGNNFVKTMLRLMGEREELNVVADQYGSPTYAADLAAALLKIMTNLTSPDCRIDDFAGIYHYANAGIITWHTFADVIRERSGSACRVNPITTDQYPTPAKRPAFSVMDTRKIQNRFKLEIPFWKDSLQKCLQFLIGQ